MSPKTKKVKKVKVSMTYTWVVEGKEWKETEEHRKTLPDSIVWGGDPINKIIEAGKDDPIFMFHQMYQLGHPDDFVVKVEPTK